jgi:hypothetical protein
MRVMYTLQLVYFTLSLPYLTGGLKSIFFVRWRVIKLLEVCVIWLTLKSFHHHVLVSFFLSYKERWKGEKDLREMETPKQASKQQDALQCMLWPYPTNPASVLHLQTVEDKKVKRLQDSLCFCSPSFSSPSLSLSILLSFFLRCLERERRWL